jgi:cytochrome c-type biogenesis protein CcmH/NrfG
MGIAYERQNRIDLAIREFEDSVRLEPANKDYRHDLARAYARRRDRGTSGPEDRIPSKGAP